MLIKHVMISYDKLKSEIETIKQRMTEAKKNKNTNALKEAKLLCIKFGFISGILKSVLAESKQKK